LLLILLATNNIGMVSIGIQLSHDAVPFLLVEWCLFSEHLLSLSEEIHHVPCRLHILLYVLSILLQACFILLDLLQRLAVVFDIKDS